MLNAHLQQDSNKITSQEIKVQKKLVHRSIQLNKFLYFSNEDNPDLFDALLSVFVFHELWFCMSYILNIYHLCYAGCFRW